MHSLRRIAFTVLGLAFALVAAVCIVRGMKALFWNAGGPTQGGGFGGISAALGYFAAGIACLLVAGEVYTRGAQPGVVPQPSSESSGTAP